MEWLAGEGQTEGIVGGDEVENHMEDLMAEVAEGGGFKGTVADAGGLGARGSHVQHFDVGVEYDSRSWFPTVEEGFGALL